MLQARFHLITADPLRLADVLKFIEAEVRPETENRQGSLGMSLYANPELGVAVLESFWATHEVLLLNENRGLPDFGDALRHAAGTIWVERCRVPVFEWDWEGPLDPGAGLRLTWMDVEPSRVEDAVEAYGDTAVPGLAETRGFCAALLLTGRSTGHLISESIWRNPQALAASRSAAATVRVEMVASTGCVIRAVDEYGLVFSSARKAWQEYT
jgi:hypothetical protein